MSRPKTMHRRTHYILVILSALAVGATLFVASFVFMDFFWTHFVVTDLEKLSIGDGVAVIGGGLIIGTVLGLLGISLTLYRFWPEPISKHLFTAQTTLHFNPHSTEPPRPPQVTKVP